MLLFFCKDIQDNIIIAHEALHNFKIMRKRVKGVMAKGLWYGGLEFSRKGYEENENSEKLDQAHYIMYYYYHTFYHYQ